MKSLKIILTTVFFLSAAIFFFTDNITISLFFNSHHSPFFDKVFPLISLLGEVGLFIFVGAVMYFVKKKKCLYFALSFINFFIVVQFLKRIIFADRHRPIVILPQIFPNTKINLIPNITLNKDFSFPSGHATIIFSLIILLIYAFEIKNSFSQICFVIIAVLVALSRLYLMQHFFCDVYFGALIGCITTFITIYFFERYDLNNKEPFKTLLNVFKF
jgi:membrane-associated phospholipid phosphatase